MRLLWEAEDPDLAARLFEAAQLIHLNETARAAVRTTRAVGEEHRTVLSERYDVVDQLRALDSQLLAELQRGTPDFARVESLRIAMAEGEARLSAVDSNLRTEMPELLEFISPRAISLGQAQESLSGGEALWLQATFTDETYLFLISSGAVEVERVGLGADELSALASELRASVDLSGRSELPVFAAKAAHSLYEGLFGAFKRAPAEYARLLAVPDLAVQEVSLATMVVGRHDGKQVRDGNSNRDLKFLGHIVPISIVPSVELLLHRVSIDAADVGDESRGLVGFGDPELEGISERGTRGYYDAFNRTTRMADPSIIRMTFEPLEESRYELEQIQEAAGEGRSELYLGSNASEATLKSLDLSQIGTLIFATHAVVATQFADLLEPALIMSPPRKASGWDDGLLLASEIALMEIGADLVILSACNTASPSGRAGAPGLSGLARSFILAGSKTIIASQWTISTVSPVLLTPALYRARTAGASAPEALRDAMAATALEYSDPFFAHPAIWGPFVVIGAE